MSGATVPGLVTALVHNLVGFAKLEIKAGGSTTSCVAVEMFQLETAQADGVRVVVPGSYMVWVGGGGGRAVGLSCF